MKAMQISSISNLRHDPEPLIYVDASEPVPGKGQVLIKVSACGVCHTELDEIEGRTPPSLLPRIPGHQVVGRVVQSGSETSRFQAGDRVGVAWIYSACGRCKFCLSGQENLCPGFQATGRDALLWAKEVEQRGAGEILLTSMDRDGTQIGYDIDLLRAVTSAVSIPVIASGGAGVLGPARYWLPRCFIHVT